MYTLNTKRPNTVEVTPEDVNVARQRWRDFWARSAVADWMPFWGWLGERNTFDATGLNNYRLSMEAAVKIRLLLGPHHHAILKALETQYTKKLP